MVSKQTLNYDETYHIRTLHPRPNATLSKPYDLPQRGGRFDDHTTTAGRGAGYHCRANHCFCRFKHLNTSEVTSISITSGDGTRLSTLRGIYRITMQGTVTYRLSDGSQHTRRFRAAQDLVDVSRKQGNQVRLTLHLL